MAGTAQTREDLFELANSPFAGGKVPSNQDHQNLGASFFSLLDDAIDKIGADAVTEAFWASAYADYTDLPETADGRKTLAGLVNALLSTLTGYIADTDALSARLVDGTDPTLGSDLLSYRFGRLAGSFPTGAVNTTVAKALDADGVRVAGFLPVDYVTDGSVDYADDVQRALNAATGGTCVFPPGITIRINTQVTIPGNTRVILSGCTVTTTVDIYPFKIEASNVSIFGGRITCGKSVYTSGNGAILATGTLNGAGVPPTYISNINVENVEIDGYGEYGVAFYYVDGGQVRRSTFTTGGYEAVLCFSCLNVNVLHNHIDGITGETTSGQLNAVGVSFTSLANSGDQVQNPVCKDCLAAGNFVANIPTWHGLHVKGGRRVHFVNNVVINCRRGIILSSAIDESSNDCVVRGNLIANYLQGTNSNGTDMQDAALWDIGGSASVKNTGNLIDGNTVFQHGPRGTGLTAAVHIQYAANGGVRGNLLSEPYRAGIVVNDDVDQYLVQGNTIIDPKGDGVAGTPAQSSDVMTGIHFRGANIDADCIGNTVIRRDATLASFVGNVGVLVVSNATKTVRFSSNRFVGMSTANFSLGADISGLSGDIDYDFSVTLTGCTTAPSATARSSVREGRALLELPALSATSNATTLTLTGLPPWLIPSIAQSCIARAQDAGSWTFAIAQVDASGGTITFGKNAAGGTWTSSGTKGTGALSLCYRTD